MKILLKIILGIGAFIFLIWLTLIHVNLHGELEDSGIWTDTIPKEYSRLIKLPDSCCKTGDIIFVNTLSSKYRNPVSRFYIDNKYYLQVYKMDSLFNYSLQKIITENFSGAPPSNTEYASDDRTDMEFLYKDTKPQKPKNIYIAIGGDSTKIEKKNDTIAYYFSNCFNISIGFKPDQENDIYARPKNKNITFVPLEVLFLKRTHNLYIFILSSKNASTRISPGTLYGFLMEDKSK